MRRKIRIEIGQRYGKLLVKAKADSEHGNDYWVCLCDCGELSKPRGSSLVKGSTRSCGSATCKNKPVYNRPIADRTGNRYGALVVREKVVVDGHAYWRCECDCGQEITVPHRKVRFRKHCGDFAKHPHFFAELHRQTKAQRDAEDLTDRRFGRLVAKYKAEHDGVLIWVCLCDCGEVVERRGFDLHTKSTCDRKEKHSLRSGMPQARAWRKRREAPEPVQEVPS